MRITLTTMIAGLLLCGGVAAAHVEQRNLNLRDLPQPVQDSIQAEAKLNPVEDIRKTTDAKGRKVYKAEIHSGDREIELTMLPGGAIIGRRVHHTGQSKYLP